MSAAARLARTEQALTTLGSLATHPLLRVIAVATTGLKGVPVEIVVVDDAGKLLYQRFIRADRPIEPDASRINGVTDAMLDGALDIRDAVAYLESNLLTPDAAIACYSPSFTYQAFTRAGADIDAAQMWENAQEIIAPLHGAWNEARQNFSFVALAAALRETAIDETNLAPSGTAYGNAQRLQRLIHWHGTAPRYGRASDDDLDGEFCPGCDQPHEFCRCGDVAVAQ